MVLVPIRCRIPDILHANGKTQQWLAEQTGYSKQRISDYVQMRCIMSLPVAALIARILKVHIDDLYVWEWQQE
ncbi:hypothetical protein D3C78_1726670 [compost metagenome]